MIWIPVIFMCMAGQCGFMQGNSTYTEQGCLEQVKKAYAVLGNNPQVDVYEGTCLPVSPV